MWNEPSPRQLERLPPLYATEHAAWRNKIIFEHFFLGGCDWFMAEYGRETRVFFGFAILNGDRSNAEWGYIDFDELRAISIAGVEVDRDVHWRIRRAGTIPQIAQAVLGIGLS